MWVILLTLSKRIFEFASMSITLASSARRPRRGLPTSLTGLVEAKRILVIVIWGCRTRRGRTWLGAPVTA